MTNIQTQAAVQQMPKNLADVVQNKVKGYQASGDLVFPANYSPDNALKSAWLILQNTKNLSNSPVLQSCTQDSIANTMLEMVVQGLDPTKKQCYFIAYGNQLTLQRSYFGTMAVTKRVANAESIDAQVIYEGDNVTYDMVSGRIIDLKHSQSFGNINKENIIGAYCIIKFNDGTEYTEVMTIDELRQSWGQSKMKKNQDGEGATHEKFRQEMSKKTVINRACKKFLNSSSNADLMVKSMIESDERLREAEWVQEVQQNANQIPLDIAPAPQAPPTQIIEQAIDGETGEVLHQGTVYTPHVESPNLVDEQQANAEFVDVQNNDGDPF